MLKMTHLSKVYRTEVVETYALRDFNINVKDCLLYTSDAADE